MKLNEKIKQLRIDNNITQRELAQKLGVSIPTLQKYEYGTLKIKSEILIKMCDIFQIELNEKLTKFLEKEKILKILNARKNLPKILYSRRVGVFKKEKDFEDNLKNIKLFQNLIDFRYNEVIKVLFLK